MRRNVLLLATFLLLSACGFSPIYGPKNGDKAPVAEALSSIAIGNIANEEGQKLRNKLIDRMYGNGRPAEPSARLTLSLQVSEVSLGIKKDSTASMIELTLIAPYTLQDMNGQKLVKGRARSLALYSRLDAQYGILAAKRNAYDRAIAEVAEQIVSRLSLFYAETPPAKPAHSPKKAMSPDAGWALRAP